MRTATGTILSKLVLMATIFFFGAPVWACELDHIRTEILEYLAKWRAEETWISKLQDWEQKNRLGLIKPILTGTEKLLPITPSQLAAVSGTVSIDWRTRGCVTPVKDQGNCGSSWAFATTAALESFQAIMNGRLLELSEQVLISCGKAGSCGGGHIDKASNFISSTGLPVESCYSYSRRNGTCSGACYNWTSSTYETGSWSWVATTSPKTDHIKAALLAFGPLVTTMNVYTDFFHYHSGVYSHLHGRYCGAHAILIVGYDDTNHCFIVKNSWGTDWGENGYFRIAYSELHSPVEFGNYTIAYRAR